MRLTNNQGLPEPLVRAVTYSDYDKEGCDYSISELLKPARIVALERQHAKEITEDASDRLWLLMGSAGHTVLERSAHKGIVEERAIVEIEVDGKMLKVGGKLDYGVSDTTLWDYKFCSVYVAKGGPQDSWVAQLNIYRWLAWKYGVPFDKLQIVAIYRDWSKREARRNPDHPQSQVQTFDLPLWRDDTTEQFIIERIRAHEAAKVTLPECTSEEMWEKPGTWAVKKPGAARATKVYYDEGNAQLHAAKSGLVVETRPPQRPRCEDYCRCALFCSQWKDFRKQNNL